MGSVFRYIGFWCFLFISNAAFSQDPLFRNYLQDEGLINATVYHSLQDSDGFLWFASESGVIRYDGQKYQRFTLEEGLPDNEILKIYQDSRKRIWFLTLSGRLSYFLKGKFYNAGNSELIRKTSINSTLVSFFEDAQQNIWLAGLDNHFLKISKNDEVSKFDLGKVSMGRESFFIQDKRQQVMLVCREGFFSVLGNKTTLRKFPYKLKNSRNFYYNGRNKLIFIAEEGLIQMQDTLQKLLIPTVNLPKSENISYLFIDKKQNLWLTSLGDGIFLYPNYTQNSLKFKNYLPGKIITSAYEDRESNLWFTTVGEGVFMQPANNFNIQNLTTTEGLFANKIYAVTADRNDQIWIGLDKGILQRITSEKIQSFDVNYLKLKYNRVKDIYFDSLNNVWIATDVGLTYLKNTPRHAYKQIPILKDQKYIYPAKTIKQNKNGNITVVYSSGIDAILPAPGKPDNFVLHRLPNLPYMRTFTHFYDGSGNLWFSNIHGLNQFKDGKYINYGLQFPLLGKRISDIIQAPDSTLILATFGYGILFFKNNKIIQRLRLQEGLPENTVTKLAINKHVVWAATNKGVAKFSYQNNKIGKPIIYSTLNGLLSNDINDIYVNNELVYLATDKGLSIINTAKIPPLPSPPSIQFTQIICRGKEIDLTKKVVLKNNQNQLTINFIAISFQAPKSILYQFRLKELGNSWVTTTDSYVNYAFLESGHYTFEVKARKGNSNWTNPLKFKFIIEPPFYRTWWFITLSAVLVIGLTFLIVRDLTTHKLQQRLRQLETEHKIQLERQRIARDLHDNVGSQLAYIINYLDETPAAKANFVPAHLRDFTKQTISELRETIWAIRQKIITIYGLENRVQKLLQKVVPEGITYEVHTKGNLEISLTPSLALNLYRIIQEAVNNVLKHSKATSLRIALTVLEDSILTISIADNGIGFDPATPLSGDHYGLLNMQDRAEELPGNLEIITSPGHGCTIQIKTKLASVVSAG